MSKVSEEDLKIRYATYVRRTKEIMRKEKETRARAMAKVALEYNITQRTVQNAFINRPMKAQKQ